MNRSKYFITIFIFFSLLFVNDGKILNAQKKPESTDTKTTIRLLTRADDMGVSYDKSLAIIKAHKEGIITSASIMPLSPFFEESVRLCKANPTLVVGVHITLLDTRARPVLSPEEVPSILTPEGFLYEDLDPLIKSNPKVEEMEKEIRAQVEKVRATGLHFVYLDWHRGVPEAAKEIIKRICKEQQLIYGQDWDGAMYGYKRLVLMPETWPTQVLPDGQEVLYSAPALTKEQQQSFFDALSNLKPGLWMTYMHPGLVHPQRASVTELLCSPRTKEIIRKKNIQLVSYYDLWEQQFGKSKRR
jgi:predicted glycoside hydrolase/deacetylase ChbG (UPF0249 family)